MSVAPVHQPPDSWWVPRGKRSFPWLGVLLFCGLCVGVTVLLVAFFDWFNAKPWLFDEYRAGYEQGTNLQNEGDCTMALARQYPEDVANATNETKAFSYGCLDAVQGLDSDTDDLAIRIRS